MRWGGTSPPSGEGTEVSVNSRRALSLCQEVTVGGGKDGIFAGKGGGGGNSFNICVRVSKL